MQSTRDFGGIDMSGLKKDVDIEAFMLKMHNIGKCECGHYEDEHIGLCALCKECNEFRAVELVVDPHTGK